MLSRDRRRAEAHRLAGEEVGVREIARRLGVNASTISRDLREPAPTIVPLANLQDAEGRPVAGAEEANERALVHGAHSERRIAPRVAELRQEIAELVPAGTQADLPAVTLLAQQLARIEIVNEYLARVGLLNEKGEPRPVLKVLSTWENSAARLLDQLGLTPTARARLGVDLTRMKGAALGEYLAKTYGEETPDA
jgi:transcriptional regulator with XRE-family HTH domain